VPSQRSFSALSLALTVLPLALSACSAAADGTSGTNNPGKNNGSAASASTGSGNTGNGPDLGTGGTGVDLIPIGGSSAGGGSSCGQVLPVIYRDFNAYGMPGGHDDFEASARGVKNSDGTTYEGWNDVGCGLVEKTLGPDGKPRAFAGMPDKKNDGVNVPAGVGQRQRIVSNAQGGCWTAANPNPTGDCLVGECVPWEISPITYAIKSTTTFDQWYNTVASVNMEVPGELMLAETAPGSGVSVYDSSEFFPIDNKGFGNTAGKAHNYHFTTEIHVKFTYQPKQVFTFRGDDDLWIFVNGKLALDVGGQHQALKGVIDFDAQAATLGITAGSSYQMDIFHAERQTDESNFRIETNIKCFERVPVK
jgi:fibro-slime domain-containing protein